MRRKICVLEEAFVGHFNDHHAFLLARMLARIDAIDADIAALDTGSRSMVAPFATAVARLDEIPGIGPTAAATIIAEIGLDMTRFPTPAHLASWAKFAPGVNESAGQEEGQGHHRPRQPPTWPACWAKPPSAPPRPTRFLGERYRRIARRRGARRPSSPSAAPSWSSSGTCWPTPRPASPTSAATTSTQRISPERRKRAHIRQLEALGYKVTLEPAA